MNHIQYYFINNFQKGFEENRDRNKVTISTPLTVDNIMKFISIKNDSILDLYFFNFTIDEKLHREFESDSRVEEFCTEFEKACTDLGINKNSIKLNIVFISQFVESQYFEKKSLSSAKINNILNYIHPFYASILKIILHKNSNMDNILKLIYNNISAPLDKNGYKKLIGLENGENICGLYFTPSFEQTDG